MKRMMFNDFAKFKLNLDSLENKNISKFLIFTYNLAAVIGQWMHTHTHTHIYVYANWKMNHIKNPFAPLLSGCKE